MVSNSGFIVIKPGFDDDDDDDGDDDDDDDVLLFQLNIHLKMGNLSGKKFLFLTKKTRG